MNYFWNFPFNGCLWVTKTVESEIMYKGDYYSSLEKGIPF